MRSLIQLRMRQDSTQNNEQLVKDWFEVSGFRPQEIDLADDIKELIRHNDQPGINSKFKIADYDKLHDKHAIEILLTIPWADQERHYALKTAKYSIHYDDPTHGNVVWGLVCIEKPSITVRWRHKVSKSLERATEEFVDRVWDEASAGRLFEKFSQGHRIPVREPNSTTDAYIGEILSPGPLLKDRAKKDKQTELKLGKFSLIATFIFFIIAFYLFITSAPDSLPRWTSGVFDRLATTGATTALLSYLSYFFHAWELKIKPIIDWK